MIVVMHSAAAHSVCLSVCLWAYLPIMVILVHSILLWISDFMMQTKLHRTSLTAFSCKHSTLCTPCSCVYCCGQWMPCHFVNF